MLARIYGLLWIGLSTFFAYEYIALNSGKYRSLLKALELQGKIHFAVSPEPGRALSLWLGWAGLILMVVMNVYSMRKRFQFMSGWGPLSAWMNFHIFCGLLGPTFILFHCNFKVRGLVGISFWSMVISFSSGIIGRYFFLQLASKKSELDENAHRWERRLRRVLEASKVAWSDSDFNTYSKMAFAVVGFQEDSDVPNPFSAFFKAFAGDLRRAVVGVRKPPHWPSLSSQILTEYAVTRRRAAFLESFQKLMGYWHAFHFPFAIFMYVAAVIHVTAALIFGV